MVRKFSSRPRTTAQDVQPSTGSMHRDNGIVGIFLRPGRC